MAPTDAHMGLGVPGGYHRPCIDCPCCRTARFCNSGAHGGQICVSWEVVEQLLKDWGQLPSPIEPNLVAMAPIGITANYMQSVLSRQKAILDAITLRATG